MAYVKQLWQTYDESKTYEENVKARAVVTSEYMNHIEEGIESAFKEMKEIEAGKPLGLVAGTATVTEVPEVNLELEEDGDYVLNLGIPAGKTPVKGEDYFTVEEQEQFVKDAVDAIVKAVPVYDEVDHRFYGNGVHCFIEAPTDGTEGAVIKYRTSEGMKEVNVTPDTYVYGGGNTMDMPLSFATTALTFNGGTVKAVAAGNRGAGYVGHATVIMNGGSISEQWNGISAGHSYDVVKGEFNQNIGFCEITINGTDGIIGCVYGGTGTGVGHVAHAKVTVNGGEVYYLTAAGSNGHTLEAETYINGGTVKVFQGCNRGTVDNIKLVVNGGKIEKMYAGGETEDTKVDATYERCELVINGGVVDSLVPGTNGKDETVDKIVGKYADGVIANAEEAAALMSLKKFATVEEVNAKLINKVEKNGTSLVFKHDDEVICAVDIAGMASGVA